MVKPVSRRRGHGTGAVRGYRRTARSVVRSRGVRGRSSSGHSSRRSRRHRTISGARRKRETQTRDARSRRRRVGTGGSFTHPKAPRPRASAATGAAPCRLASRPSGHCRRETVAFKQATGDLISHSRSGAVAHSRSRPEGLLFASPLLGGATQQPLAAARGRDASPLERRGGGVRHGGAPPGVESGQEHRHARRAVRTHLLRSHAIPRPAKDVPSESRRGPSGRPVKRDSLEAHAVEGSRMPSSPRVSSRVPARLSTPRTAATPAAR